MGMNETPSGERIHIGFFGRRNAGKSSLVNAVTGQDLAVVSDVRGTTTDPVTKAMELLPMGPVVIIDTPGFDDEGSLGELRIRKTRQVLNRTDVAVLVADSTEELKPCDKELMELFRKKEIPYLIAWNKCDLLDENAEEKLLRTDSDGSIPTAGICVSALQKTGIQELKECIAHLGQEDSGKKALVRDLIRPLDRVILVIPIDKAAPKGRLILPQQQVIRDILEAEAVSVVVKENGLKNILDQLKENPRMVITDSQVFKKVSKDTPADVPLTSFSILMARYKGNLEQAVRGVTELDRLKDGDVVLISEGCTHHRQCEDIGTVKIPRWIREYTGKEIQIETTSGTEFPDDLSKYKLIIHCGGCMLNEREMKYRYSCAADQGIPITNYGIMIAYVNGILKRSVELFPELYEIL